jgi:adenylate cyclase
MLFADIRGSTSLAEDMQPAEFRRLINRFYLSATDVLCESNALIDKLAGDQVSAYFVPGLVGQDHASQALQAARDLLLATGHDEPGGPWIPVGIGVHTGVAFIGSVGARGGLVDVTALGDAVNITARMASLAGPGQILASEETLSAAEIDPTGRESRSIALKGRSQPVNIYTL